MPMNPSIETPAKLRLWKNSCLGRPKNEFFRCRDWRGVGYREFRERLATHLTRYDETRIKKSLGWQSPVQYRKSLGLVA